MGTPTLLVTPDMPDSLDPEREDDSFRRGLRAIRAWYESQGRPLGARVGCGTYACAFRLKHSPERVVKVTGDVGDAGMSMHVLRAWQNGEEVPRSIVRIHDVRAFPGAYPGSGGSDRRPLFTIDAEYVPGGLTQGERRLYEQAILSDPAVFRPLVEGRMPRTFGAELARVHSRYTYPFLEQIRGLAEGYGWFRARGWALNDTNVKNLRVRETDKGRTWVFVDLGFSRGDAVKIPRVDLPRLPPPRRDDNE